MKAEIQEPKAMRLVELYEGNLFECQMIKNLLENEGIETVIHDEIIGSRAGGLMRPAGGVRLMVSDENFERAVLVVREFEKTRIE